MPNIIKTKGLVFKNLITYPDINITAGQVTFITGKSGCGKSTLLRLFNAINEAADDSIFYNDIDINKIDTITLRKEILLAGQTVFLFDKNIRDNFEEFYKYRGLKCPSDYIIKNHLNVCSADFPLDKDCTTMSGGERQRVFIAICLSFEPKVLMVDEPTSALDESNSNSLIASLSDFAQRSRMTLIVVSHNKSLAEKYADKIIELGNARNE